MSSLPSLFTSVKHFKLVCNSIVLLHANILTSGNMLVIDEPLEYAKLYLDGNLQMWVDAEDSLEL